MQRIRANGMDIAKRARSHAALRESRGIDRVAICVGIAIAIVAVAAFAEPPDVPTEQSHWQERYRSLVAETEILRAEIQHERELYADANRRNYRRGQKRHVHRIAAEKAEQELAKVQAQLATIEDDARRAGLGRGWLNQIEMELEDGYKRPAVAAGSGSDIEGRNPLYLEPPADDANAKSAERNLGRNPLYFEQADEGGAKTGK